MGYKSTQSISSNPPSIHRIIVAVVVVNQGQLGVIELAAPLDGLGGAAGGGYGAVGSVGIGGVDVTGGAEYLAHVLGEVKAVCVPAAAPPVLWLGKPKEGCRGPIK